MNIRTILLVLLFAGWTASTVPAHPADPDTNTETASPASVLSRENPDKTDYSTADSINGIYIPRNIGECMTELDKHISDSLKTVLLEGGYSSILDKHISDSLKTVLLEGGYSSIDLHFSLGMWIRNNFGLWRDSRLAHYLRNNGPCSDRMDEPDDMSDYILSEYLGHLKLTHEKN